MRDAVNIGVTALEELGDLDEQHTEAPRRDSFEQPAVCGDSGIVSHGYPEGFTLQAGQRQSAGHGCQALAPAGTTGGAE